MLTLMRSDDSGTPENGTKLQSEKTNKNIYSVLMQNCVRHILKWKFHDNFKVLQLKLSVL